MALAVAACGRVEYEESRWRIQNFPSPDGAYLARVAERTSGDANEAGLTIAIVEVAKAGSRTETQVYFGEAGQRCSVVWNKDREVTIAVPNMNESSDEVGAVTVRFVRLEPGGR
jgi:hypothetical protein